MEAHLPYKSVVLFIACGTMVSWIVVVFAKRQINRFKLKSNRVPHAAIGSNVPKSLRREIELRLKRIEQIKYEPPLLSEVMSSSAMFENCHFVLRMKAMDGVKLFDGELQRLYPDVKRQHGESLRMFLLDQQLHESGCLYGISLETIDRFAHVYEHARHDPTPFLQEHYDDFMDLLNSLIDHMVRKHGNQHVDGVLMEASFGVHSHSEEELNRLIHSDDSRHNSLSNLAVGATVLGATVIPTVAAHTDQEYTELHTNDDLSPERDSHIIYRPRRMKDSDSGMFLLNRQSGSSQGSTVDIETRFARTGLKDGEESYV